VIPLSGVWSVTLSPQLGRSSAGLDAQIPEPPAVAYHSV